MIRFFPALLLGLLISTGLFWFMNYMIMNNQQGLKNTEDLRMVEFVRLKRDSKIETKTRRQPDPPPPPEKRPPPPKMQMQQTNITQETPDMDMPNLDIPMQSRFNSSLLNGVQAGVSTGAPGLGAISTNLIPLVRIPPRYPMRAKSRRIQGWVKVEFTITVTGTVTDAKVVDAHPSSIFNRSALRALAKWKFKAKLVNGKAVTQRAAQVLQFTLTK